MQPAIRVLSDAMRDLRALVKTFNFIRSNFVEGRKIPENGQGKLSAHTSNDCMHHRRSSTCFEVS
jgi:hypothetical protein